MQQLLAELPSILAGNADDSGSPRAASAAVAKVRGYPNSGIRVVCQPSCTDKAVARRKKRRGLQPRNSAKCQNRQPD